MTNHPDRNGDKMSVEALRSLRKQLAQYAAQCLICRGPLDEIGWFVFLEGGVTGYICRNCEPSPNTDAPP